MIIFTAGACDKNDVLVRRSDNAQSWFATHGGRFKDGVLRVESAGGGVLQGALDWDKVRTYTTGNRKYWRVPYVFDGQTIIASPTDNEEQLNFDLVVREGTAGSFEGAILSTARNSQMTAADGKRMRKNIENFHLLTGAESTIWVSDINFNNKTKARRVSGAAPEFPSAAGKLMLTCVTLTFTERWVDCYVSDGPQTPVVCSVESSLRFVTICSGSENRTVDGDWWSDAGGGGGPVTSFPEGPQPDPGCATAQAQQATTFAKGLIFYRSRVQIQNAAADGKEHGISFGKDNNGDVIQSGMSTRNDHSGTVGGVTNLFADLHNHQDNNPPSSGDIYGFIDRVIANPDYTTRYVITANGLMYALVITDKQAAINFNQNHPRQPGIGDMEPMFPEGIEEEMREMRQLGGATIEMATAFILEKYNIGVSLLKQNQQGDFNKLRTKEGPVNAYGQQTYQSNNCQ